MPCFLSDAQIETVLAIFAHIDECALSPDLQQRLQQLITAQLTFPLSGRAGFCCCQSDRVSWLQKGKLGAMPCCLIVIAAGVLIMWLTYNSRAPLSNRGYHITQRNANRWLERSNNMAESSSDISKLHGWFSSTMGPYHLYTQLNPSTKLNFYPLYVLVSMFHLTALVYYG